MTEYYVSRLSTKRILLSLTLVFLLRPIASAVDHLIGERTLAWMFALNIIASFLIIYDWNLFGIHYNRAKSNKGDYLIYTALGLILIGGLVVLDMRFLQGSIPLPDSTSLHANMFAFPAVLIAFSFMQSSIVNIGFKCLTDHLKVHSNELTIILLSGLLFAPLYTVIFAEFQVLVFLRTLVYNVILLWILSYLYNQSNSFMPGLTAMGIVYLFLQITMMM